MNIPEEYKTNLEKEFEEDQQKEKQNDDFQMENEQEITLLDRVLQLPKEERRLTLRSYLEYICDDLNSENAIYIPVNTVTPSELEGFTLEEERRFRVYGCELIQEAGILLKLPMVTMATGQAILHRFFFRKSFIRCEVLTVATASMFLAAKIEENPRKIRDLVTVFDYVHKLKKGMKNPTVLDLNSFLFTDSKSELVDAERFILKELGFSTDKIQTGNVHKYIYFYLKALEGTKQLAQKAWNYVNDCYRTICVVSFPPNVVAASCIYMAARMIDYPLPNLEWWKIFGVKFEDIQYVCSSMIELYQMEGEEGEKHITSQYIEKVLNRIKDEKQREKEEIIKQLKEEGKYERPTKWGGNQNEPNQDKEMIDQESTPEPHNGKKEEEKQTQQQLQTTEKKDQSEINQRRRSTSRGRKDYKKDYQTRDYRSHHHRSDRHHNYHRSDRNRRSRSRDKHSRHHHHKRRRSYSNSVSDKSNSDSENDRKRSKKHSRRSRSKDDKRSKKDAKRKRSRSKSSKSSSLD